MEGSVGKEKETRAPSWQTGSPAYLSLLLTALNTSTVEQTHARLRRSRPPPSQLKAMGEGFL